MDTQCEKPPFLEGVGGTGGQLVAVTQRNCDTHAFTVSFAPQMEG